MRLTDDFHRQGDAKTFSQRGNDLNMNQSDRKLCKPNSFERASAKPFGECQLIPKRSPFVEHHKRGKADLLRQERDGGQAQFRHADAILARSGAPLWAFKLVLAGVDANKSCWFLISFCFIAFLVCVPILFTWVSSGLEVPLKLCSIISKQMCKTKRVAMVTANCKS